MRAYHEKEGKYTTDIQALKQYSKDPFHMSDDADMIVVLKDNGGFEASALLNSFIATVNQERYLVASDQERLVGASGVSTDL